MLRQLNAVHAPFRLNRPFRISRGVKSVADTIAVEIREGDWTGRGESVPYARYGETVESVLSQIEDIRGEIEAGADRYKLLEIMPAGAARNALDCALWDLEAARDGISVASAIGRDRVEPVATAMTVSLDTPEAMAASAKALSGVPLLKIKVNGDKPLDAIRAVREVAPSPRVIVDPNESWSIEQLSDWQDELVNLRVDLLEQPLPAGEDEVLEGFKRSVPLAADESGHVADDLSWLARRYDYVNIKLDKTGGLTMALAMLAAAEREKIGLMVGCMTSSSLSIAPAIVIAQRCEFIDLDGPTWLAEDREGGLIEDCGVMFPPAPGFWGNL
ncbi:L-alanine-DL-glutamate epimerase-like enolase superfamily enzyme [Altererythrobacter atlanticus]|uniref:Dipeptide epimerase n=1 Tax=Croceibacterium atlanticum TaxID=1267766 RepID=A0A0F7KS52_9SPHN|nr:N-acetyl-D-Glu racemase DgcA [Croceibacterium atlanticum]AKH41946.1 L-Ala-D/L-Glu epimerase [Croceibacterium atlanticum]MBB5733487.1 L-alanine-DL-glutamate epimerase-like enolase superfamily enzyme [Croceibacterium atlanticum]